MKRFYHYTALLLCFSALWSCQRYDEIDPSRDGTPVELELNLAPAVQQVVEPTRSSISENQISDANVWVFDNSGVLLNHYYHPTVTGSTITMRGSSGLRNILVLANFGRDITGITSPAEVRSTAYTNTSPVGMTLSPMFGETGTITVAAPSTPSGTVTLAPLSMTRLQAKITVTFDTSGLTANTTIKPTKIVLCQVPNYCQGANANSPAVASVILSRGDSLSVASGITSTSHTTATPLFMLENMQGTSPYDYGQIYKTPPSGKEPYCSYLEVTADYISYDKNGVVKYRYYLGANNTTNFDIVRNNWYQVSIKFNGRGGVYENTWRVDLAGMTDLLTPKTLYMPYQSGRTTMFLYSAGSLSGLPTMSGMNPVTCVVDSVHMFITKSSNESTIRQIGAFNNGGSVIKVLPKATHDMFVDVSNLFFPKNAQFGSKNYHVLQYIHLTNVTTQPAWEALSGASWLYIGNGPSCQAFSAAGVANSASTFSGMKNLNAGPLTASEAMSRVIAVRCTENTSDVTRRAQIVIYHPVTKQEFARVFVSQNPSSYPKSPVNVVLVPGGIMHAGAYNSSGVLPAIVATSASVRDLHVSVTPFYMARKETTIQQFCDYMNDLGITSLNQLAGANTILGKSGVVNTDYPGLNTATVGTPVVNTMTMFANGSGKWVPSTRGTYGVGGATLPEMCEIGNWPMSQINFYGACDYGYWSQLYNGKTLTRLTTRMLPAELEWEAAARGINNKLTTVAAFTANSYQYKNGTFPFATPTYSDYNYGKNGAETTNDDNLTTFLWYKYNGTAWVTTTGGLSQSEAEYSTHPSGNLFPNSLGLYDMNGNVSEWTMDNYNGETRYYWLNALETSPIYFSTAGGNSSRMVRGGDLNQLSNACTNVSRAFGTPTNSHLGMGFRIAIHP